jgi:hypothetical protein
MLLVLKSPKRSLFPSPPRRPHPPPQISKYRRRPSAERGVGWTAGLGNGREQLSRNHESCLDPRHTARIINAANAREFNKLWPGCRVRMPARYLESGRRALRLRRLLRLLESGPLPPPPPPSPPSPPSPPHPTPRSLFTCE